MVFFFSPKQFHPRGLYTPQRFMAQLVQEQSLNQEDIQETPPDPDPAMVDAFTKSTSLKDLGDNTKGDEDMGISKLSGQGFRVYGGQAKPTNQKLRKFISLKL